MDGKMNLQKKDWSMRARLFCPESCDIDRLRHRRSKPCVFAGESGNDGTADGLHARCVPALRRTDTGRRSNRGVPAAKHPAALRAVPRGVRTKSQREPAGCAETARRPTETPR